MALDSVYGYSEVKKSTEVKHPEKYKKDIEYMKRLVDSLPTNDMDQEWIKENEGKEVTFTTSQPKNDDEQLVDDILAKFKKARESNNNMRNQMRQQQLSPLSHREIQEQIDFLSGGRSR